MRGKGCCQNRRQAQRGITPAYAGKRLYHDLVHVCDRDHPRVCGEKCQSNFLAELADGITPAYAGKSFALRMRRAVSRDHPRVCGEKRALVVGLISGLRITPAYAGKR